MDSNHRPLPCQGSALDQLSYGPAKRLSVNSTGRRAIPAMLGSQLEQRMRAENLRGTCFRRSAQEQAPLLRAEAGLALLAVGNRPRIPALALSRADRQLN